MFVLIIIYNLVCFADYFIYSTDHYLIYIYTNIIYITSSVIINL